MNSATSVGKQETTRPIFECEGSTVKGVTIERYKQLIGKEGPQTDDMNSASQSAEIQLYPSVCRFENGGKNNKNDCE